MNLLINADARNIPLANESVNCVITSPPYYGLRNYQVDNQIGLEQTPDEYVQEMVRVFREVWRVLRDDGTVWLVLGDSYASAHVTGTNDWETGWKHGELSKGYQARAGGVGSGIKPKDLIGIPWRVAFALQGFALISIDQIADLCKAIDSRDMPALDYFRAGFKLWEELSGMGWYWNRSDIIWQKLNPLPESVKDRPTSSHEYIFLLTKSAKYWYDNEAIKEPYTSEPEAPRDKSKEDYNESFNGGRWSPGERDYYSHGGRNKRDVWTVSTKPYHASHYAVFPPDLIEPCILAGCPPKVCAKCGAPYERIIENGNPLEEWKRKCGADSNGEYKGRAQKDYKSAGAQDASATKARILAGMVEKKTVGWRPTCNCNAGARPGMVLDPFVGSGTTCMVAQKHERDAIGLDLKFEYLNVNARERLQYGSYVPIDENTRQLTLRYNKDKTLDSSQ